MEPGPVSDFGAWQPSICSFGSWRRCLEPPQSTKTLLPGDPTHRPTIGGVSSVGGSGSMWRGAGRPSFHLRSWQRLWGCYERYAIPAVQRVAQQVSNRYTGVSGCLSRPALGEIRQTRIVACSGWAPIGRGGWHGVPARRESMRDPQTSLMNCGRDASASQGDNESASSVVNHLAAGIAAVAAGDLAHE